MKYVYLLHHTHVISEDNEDVKLIGAFSSEGKAQEIVKKYKKLPGFKEVQDGFDIDKYQIDEECWSDGLYTTEEKSQL